MSSSAPRVAIQFWSRVNDVPPTDELVKTGMSRPLAS